MAQHDYTPEEALKLLVSRIDERMPELGVRIREVIDAGTVDEVKVPAKGRKKSREYRRARPFTDEEALNVATQVLRASFVELPACTDALFKEFSSAGIRSEPGDKASDTSGDISRVDEEKQIEIEVLRETARMGSDTDELFRLERASASEIDEQRKNLNHLSKLLDFT